MGAFKKQGRQCLLAVVGLAIFLTDAQLLNAATLSGSGGNSSLQQNHTGNNAGVNSWTNAESQQLQHSTIGQPRFRRDVPAHPLFHLLGNVAKDTAVVLDALNPLKVIFPPHVPSTTATSEATATTIATTTQQSAQKDPIGELLLGFRKALTGTKRPTTDPAKTTIAPPAGGHGRGFPALVFNAGNIIQKILEIIGALLHWFDHPEPSYLINTVQSLMESLWALKDIYLQRDEEGGIGEIPKHVVETLSSIMSLVNSLHNNTNMIQLFAASQPLFRHINELKDDFIEPISTTPTPGGLIGNLFHGFEEIGKFLNPHKSPNTTTNSNNTGLEKLPGEFGHVFRSIGKLIHTSGDIEEIIQSHDRRNILLQFIGKIKDMAELCFTNGTLDKENILDVLQKVFIPNTTLSQIIANIGKILQNDFPNNGIVQSIGGLLQQKMLVDLGLSISVRNLDFLRFGNIKHYLLQNFTNLENILVGNDLNKLLAGAIDILDNLAGTFELFLRTFYGIVDPLFGTIQQLNIFPKHR